MSFLGRQLGWMVLAVLLCSQGAVAQSADYFLERVAIHARALQAALDSEKAAPVSQEPKLDFGGETEDNVEPALSMEPEVSWSTQLVQEDLEALQEDLENWKSELPSNDKNVYQRVRAGLERHSRRLRVSTSPLVMSPEQQMKQRLLLLELDEAAVGIDSELRLADQRRELQRRERRSRSNISIGFGGWNTWGGWGPGWGAGFWGADPFFHRGFRRGFIRRGFRGGCW